MSDARLPLVQVMVAPDSAMQVPQVPLPGLTQLFVPAHMRPDVHLLSSVHSSTFLLSLGSQRESAVPSSLPPAAVGPMHCTQPSVRLEPVMRQSVPSGQFLAVPRRPSAP